MSQTIQLGGTAMAVLGGIVVLVAVPRFWFKVLGVALIVAGLLVAKL